ncbi:MAG TPA: outer membrane lipid asymmetry maintenance protein MlaD [bacterium]
MRRTSWELGVGVFMLAGLLAVGYLTIRLGRMELFGGDAYTVKARFQNVTGLKSGAAVEIAGVTVGTVAGVEVNPQTFAAVVTLRIRTGIELTDDTIASIKTQGLIGDKFVKLSPGGSGKTLKPGETILDTESAVDLEDLISRYVMGKV